MKKYLLYTSEGYCEAPDGDSIENCQYLGRVEADNEEEAIDKFFNEEEWPYEREYDPCMVTAVQLADNERV